MRIFQQYLLKLLLEKFAIVLQRHVPDLARLGPEIPNNFYASSR